MTCWPKHKDCAHREYIGNPVVWRGLPAKIVLTPDGYAKITPLDPEKGDGSEYSWMAVYNIVANRKSRFE